MTTPWTSDDLFQRLDELGIQVETTEHEPVYTVEQSQAARGDLPGAHTKNLFLRNKKGQMWLVVVAEEKSVDLKALSASLNAGRLSFGSADRLQRHLGIIPGAVTPFAVCNDAAGSVQLVIDAPLLEVELLHCHPLENDKTTAIAPNDLVRFAEACAHAPQVITVPERAAAHP